MPVVLINKCPQQHTALLKHRNVCKKRQHVLPQHSNCLGDRLLGNGRLIGLAKVTKSIDCLLRLFNVALRRVKLDVAVGLDLLASSLKHDNVGENGLHAGRNRRDGIGHGGLVGGPLKRRALLVEVVHKLAVLRTALISQVVGEVLHGHVQQKLVVRLSLSDTKLRVGVGHRLAKVAVVVALLVRLVGVDLDAVLLSCGLVVVVIVGAKAGLAGDGTGAHSWVGLLDDGKVGK
jgi:hypothetical protein